MSSHAAVASWQMRQVLSTPRPGDRRQLATIVTALRKAVTIEGVEQHASCCQIELPAFEEFGPFLPVDALLSNRQTVSFHALEGLR
ncbi:MAG: hypothetical protein LBV34_26035 [Nocardiopsaceae bacterium]|nr:hypothetical protein [Nocardiopsaceae bacterium]